MIPYIAAGIFVLGATAVAWLLDRQTEEEHKWHNDLARSHQRARDAIYAASTADAHTQALAREEHGRHLIAEYGVYCRQFRERLEVPAIEFEDLARRLDQDLADVSISPYRRNALRLLKGRLQDTQSRLKGFFAYCEWYQDRLASLSRREAFNEVIELARPHSRLPDDWLYDGKVALASVMEIGITNIYGQKLGLLKKKLLTGKVEEYSDSLQRSLMMQYPDQRAIPVQILSQKSRHFFNACLFRGALHVEHILQNAPCTAFIEKPFTMPQHGDGYIVWCYPNFCSVDQQQAIGNGIRAFMPRSELTFPGKRYSPGERVNVYIHYFDLLLRPDVTVTQHVDSLCFEDQNAAPVFVHVDTAIHDLQALEYESADAKWQLRSAVETKGAWAISFQIGAWQVDTRVSAEDGQLEVRGITRTGFDSVELDSLPCPLRLIDRRFKDDIFSDRLQFQAFITFCRQQSLFASDDQARKRAGEFFKRWNEVTTYLLAEDGYETFNLTGVKEIEPKNVECACDRNLAKNLQELMDKARNPPRLFLEKLYLGDNGEQRWLQIAELFHLPEAVAVGRYQIAHNGFKRPDRGYIPMQPERQRVRFPNQGELATLGRQKQALQGFMGGRLVNPILHQILLMPELYAAQPDPFWVERVSGGLQWQNPNWKDPDKAIAAKRIIEAALAESNLYLVQGPPGTGKTTCIVELLYQLFSAKPDSRILVVSQQNTAVDNALDRFLEQFPAYGTHVLRIGNDPAKVQDSIQPRMTEKLLMSYLCERQQAYSLASLENPSKAHWIGEWMDSIYRPDKTGQPQFDDELAELVANEHKLVGATCVGLSSRRYGMDRLDFDICIIDEAGRATVPELLIPLMRTRKAIIIGDHFQLPPSIASHLFEADAKNALPFLEDAFLKTSFFEQLYTNLPQACSGRLTEQFRMVEPIGDLVADLFYTDNQTRGLQNGRVHARDQFVDPQHCLRWVDVPHGRQEKESGGSASLRNRDEAHAILRCLEAIVLSLTTRQTEGRDKFVRKTVAIITPYSAQKRLILERYTELRRKMPLTDSVLEIKIDTVDSFQGSEADIVLYSTVRTQGRIRFLLDRRRLNVACSRARENLMFFGHVSFLRKQERNGDALFTQIIERSTLTTYQSYLTQPNRASSVPFAIRRDRIEVPGNA